MCRVLVEFNVVSRRRRMYHIRSGNDLEVLMRVGENVVGCEVLVYHISNRMSATLDGESVRKLWSH